MGTVPMGVVEFSVIAIRQASRSPPVERSMMVSAPHFSAHSSFSISSWIPDEMGEAPMLALIFVFDARPIAMGTSLCLRWFLFAGMTILPAATSWQIWRGVRCGSFVATIFISAVILPSRAFSSCVKATKPCGADHASGQWMFSSWPWFSVQSFGMKFHAVFVEGAGMLGVSGDEKVRAPSGPGAIFGFSANEPGVVVLGRPGLPCAGGVWKASKASCNC